MPLNSIINNNVIDETPDVIKYKITLFVKKYLYDNKNIILDEYMHQILWFHKYILNDIYDIIIDNIKNYIIYNRNNIRNAIENDDYNMFQLCEYIQVCFDKINYINKIFKLDYELININNTKTIYKIYEYLYDYIINDPIIITIIENLILNHTEENKNNIESYFKLIKTIYESKYDLNKYNYKYNYIYLNHIKSINIIIYSNYINKFNIHLPDNIKYISMLNNNIDIIKDFNIRLSCIYDDIIIYLITYINNNIFDILTNNTIYELYNIINNEKVASILHLCSFNIEFIEKLIFLISNSSDEDIIHYYKFVSIFHFINIKTIYIHFDKIYNVLYDKIYKNFDNSKLLNDIIFDIHLTIFNNKQNNFFLMNKIITSFSNTDIFNTIYIKYVKIRCMYFYSEFISGTITINNILYKLNNEVIILSNLNLLNKSLCIIVKNIVHDIHQSITYSSIDINEQININVIITSHYWNINDNAITSNFLTMNSTKNNILIDYIIKFNNTYVENYKNQRKLYWYLHYGNVDIIYLNKNIKMLPIHMIILDIICDNKFKISDFKTKDFLNLYPLDFINNLLNSLLFSKLVIIENEILIMNESDNFTTDIINIFLIYYYNKTDIIENDDLGHSYKYILIANINHELKLQSLNYTNLFNIIRKNNILASINNEIFLDTLNYMIEMEYIIMNNLLYEKIYY